MLIDLVDARIQWACYALRAPGGAGGSASLDYPQQVQVLTPEYHNDIL